MGSAIIAVIVVLVIVVLLALFLVVLYNNLIKLRNMVDNAWAQIEVQLQRRLDLIPNLVETVKGYAAHEAGTFDAVTNARAAVMKASNVSEMIEADNALTGALKSLFAVAEAYPDLKANQNFLQLQGELSNTEDKISYMRQSYNDTVMKLNTAIQTFPAVLFAGLMGFKARLSFDAQSGAETPPAVQFTA